MMMDDGPDLGDILGTMLMDDDGKNIVNALTEIKSQMELQNRLLIKLISAVTDLKPKPSA